MGTSGISIEKVIRPFRDPGASENDDYLANVCLEKRFVWNKCFKNKSIHTQT